MIAQKGFSFAKKEYVFEGDEVVACYLDLGIDEQRGSRLLIISPDSSGNLFKKGDAQGSAYNELVSFDMVCVDELDSFLAYLASSSTLSKNRVSVVARTNALIQSATYFLGIDADLSDLSLRYMSKLRDQSKTILVHNTKKTNKKSYRILQTFDVGWRSYSD